MTKRARKRRHSSTSRPVELLTIEEAARYLNVSKTSLRRWTNAGELRCHRVGVRALRRFAVADLEDFLRSPLGDQSTPNAAPDSPISVLDAGVRRGCVRHVCSHFHDIEESWRLFRPYFAYHAERGAPIFYFYDSTPPQRFREFVQSSGFDPDELAVRGLLELIHPTNAYLRTGAFSVSAMLSFVEDTIVRLRQRGHAKILISGEMTWSLGGVRGSEGMIAYEERLNELLRRYPELTIVCHYSMERFGAELTLDALRAHPFVQLPQGLFPGLYAGSAPDDTTQNSGSP